MNKNLYSPSMLKNFLSCRYLIFNEVNEKKLGLTRKEKTVSDILRLEQGNIHEEEYFNILKDKYSKVVDIKEMDISREEKFNKTIDSMKKGYEVIHGGYLKDEKWIGEFDFLIINKNLKSDFGNYSYEVVDTKNSSKAKVEHSIQLGMYTYLLEKIQGVLPKSFYIVLKDLKKEEVKLNQVNEFFKNNKKKYEHFVTKELDQAKPEKCSFCAICDWQENCEEIFKGKRHTNQIGGITKVHIKKFNSEGINTIDKVGTLDPKKKISGMRDEIRKKLIEQAKLQLEYEKTGKPVFSFIKENLTLQKGFNLLPKPSSCDLFFDIESVPDYVVDGSLEYLFGIYYIENGKENFKAFWAHNKEEEKQSVIDFFDFTKKHFIKYPDAKIYHYASYEIKALERLTSIHKVKGIEYDHYLHLAKFIDLFRVTKQSILVSENSYSIKNIEKFYNFERTGDVQKGDVSQDYYIQWLQNKDKKFLRDIEDYNHQDCHSTFQLREWLLSIKPKETSWFVPTKTEMEIRESEEKMLDYQHRVNKSNIKNIKIKELLSDIIGFYSREAKPEWREYFDRKHLSDDELMEDRECIGKMKLENQEKVKQSILYTYSFEDQEYKFRKRDTVVIANNLDPDTKDYAGKIEELDQINRKIKILKGTRSNPKPLPDILSIGRDVRSPDPRLIHNMYMFVDSVMENKKDYKAILSILNKEIPDIKGIKSGDKIIKQNDFTKEIPEVISNLKDSYLYIQGPPGTGKTYQASNAILELIRQGKKIAVTGNSHDVIHNLLDRIETEADKKKIKFKGLKMGSQDKEYTIYNGKYVKFDKNEKHYIDGLKDKSVLLFAGTKYHLANTFYHQNIDYLFIDEAGQISLADLICIGSIAKNIILIGDQLQLGQPIKGSHPGDSGLSILDYLLDGYDTIPDNRGVFLNKTFRLRPEINEFISENFYDGRLECHEKSLTRTIDYPKDCIIKNNGIHFLEMDHVDNVQTSIEEFEVVNKIIKQLTGSKFINENKKERKLTLEDFLIISPYNAQVNFLLSRLPEGAKVGTIDKFQGQEAPVTIISMTSSDSESLPRNREFFFSRNRLNVAISRAQCASIILFNPQLLEFLPNTLEQVKLLNNFYKLLSYK